MKNKRKYLALLLTVAMSLGVFCAFASGTKVAGSETQAFAAIDYGLLKNVGNSETAVAAVMKAIEGWTPLQMADSAYIEELTAFAEAAVSTASAVKNPKGNEVHITEASFSSAQERADEALNAVKKAINDAKITLNRNIRKILRMDLVSGNSVSIVITLDNSASYISADIISVQTGSVGVSFMTENIDRMTNDSTFVITVSPVLDGSYPKSLGTGYTYWIALNKPVEESVTVSLPLDGMNTKYLSVLKAGQEPIGGVYNRGINMLDFAVLGDGLYVAKENPITFSDISLLDQETIEAIGFLAARGIVGAKTDGLFAPDDVITRAELAMYMTKAMGVYDPSLDGGFADVSPDDWYCGAAGAVKKYRLMTYFANNEFEGDMPVARTLALSMSAIALNSQMRYAFPKDNNVYLADFSDRSLVPNWAQQFVALAAREGIVSNSDKNLGMLMPDAELTRGEAALLIKRMYDKLWSNVE
jgi:hypothetical protein